MSKQANQPFNLDKLNYKANQRKKRKKVYLWSISPVIIIFATAMWFILPSVLTAKAIGAYNEGDFKGARRWLTPLTWTSPERFVIAFNTGTVDTKLEKYDLAEKELTRAVAIAPPEKRCIAAQNLAASLKTRAEGLKNNEKQASIYQTKATIVIKANPTCFKKPPVPPGGGGGGGSSDNAAAQSEALSESQQQQLQQKEQEGRERKAQFARDETFNPDDPKIKPW